MAHQAAPVLQASPDCSNPPPGKDPAWLSTCPTDGGCLRVAVRSTTRPALVVDNSTHNVSHGFHWCIDYTNSIVYAKINGSQPQDPPYSAAYFMVNDDKQPGAVCQFFVTHWAGGDIINIYQQLQMNCTAAYIPWQLPGKDGVTNASVTVT